MAPETQRPLIVIIGRPNVGKSTLFNRLIGSRKAVVSPVRGTTRDRVEGQARWRGRALTLVDCGGFEFTKESGLAAAIQRHVRQAIQEADGIVFVCDAPEGLVPMDELIMERLRETGKPITVVVNKADHRPVVPPEFFRLGVGEILPVSALHGRGIGELLDRLVERFPSPGSPPAPPGSPVMAIAIIGRQNVGKSSLYNALVREERVIVSEAPGTTRDAIDTLLTVDGTPVRLIDTAGLRHRRKVKSPVDLFAMSRSMEAIERCDVALVVLDATQGLTQDDRRIVQQVCDAGRGLVVLMNKWDLVNGGRERTLPELIHHALPAAAFAPVIAVSATTGFHVAQSLTVARSVFRAMHRPMSDEDCHRLVQELWGSRPAPRCRGRTIHLQQARWVPGRPVRVELTVRPAGYVPVPFRRFLLKRLSTHPRVGGIPIRLIVMEQSR